MKSPVIEDLAAHLVAIHDELRFQFYEAQDRYKDYADRNRKIHPNFQIGDHIAFTTEHTNQKDYQESWIIKNWVHLKLLRK